MKSIYIIIFAVIMLLPIKECHQIIEVKMLQPVISAKGIEVLKKAEGFRSKPYQCSAGVWTVGYGMTRWNGRSVESILKENPSFSITEREGHYALLGEAGVFAAEVFDSLHKAPKYAYSQSQMDALVIFAFNVGMPRFRNSTLLSKINKNAPVSEIIAEFKKWVWVINKKTGTKRIDKGLKNRRDMEIALFLDVNIEKYLDIKPRSFAWIFSPKPVFKIVEKDYIIKNVEIS